MHPTTTLTALDVMPPTEVDELIAQAHQVAAQDPTKRTRILDLIAGIEETRRPGPIETAILAARTDADLLAVLDLAAVQ